MERAPLVNVPVLFPAGGGLTMLFRCRRATPCWWCSASAASPTSRPPTASRRRTPDTSSPRRTPWRSAGLRAADPDARQPDRRHAADRGRRHLRRGRGDPHPAVPRPAGSRGGRREAAREHPGRHRGRGQRRHRRDGRRHGHGDGAGHRAPTATCGSAATCSSTAHRCATARRRSAAPTPTHRASSAACSPSGPVT